MLIGDYPRLYLIEALPFISLDVNLQFRNEEEKSKHGSYSFFIYAMDN
jgi:hypothetical protein